MLYMKPCHIGLGLGLPNSKKPYVGENEVQDSC